MFRQLVDDDLGCASYLIGDAEAGVAVAVDPPYAIEPLLEEAARAGVRIVRVLETHTHADHVSGHGRLALEHGIPVSTHPLGEPEYPFDPVSDGDELAVGAVAIRVVHTPGHRPEHCSFVVLLDGEPQLVLTGDSLFVGDAARPDLAVGAREGAEGLFHSLRRLTALPEGVEVYPGHVAGSLCGGSMSAERFSTIGAEKQTNAALQIPVLEDFVVSSSCISAPRPPTVERVVALNRGPFLSAPEPLRPIAYEPGLTVLDVRPAVDHATGHTRGAFNVPVSGSSFATKAGFVLDPDERIAIHASSWEDAERAARGLRAIGLLEVEGVLQDPPTGDGFEPVAVGDLDALLAEGETQVLDVREKDEHDEGYIPGTRHMSYRLLRACATDVADGRPIVTVCESGPRACVAASILRAAGVDARPVLAGGISDWRARGGHTVEFRRCGT